jgi:hypothetical protein
MRGLLNSFGKAVMKRMFRRENKSKWLSKDQIEVKETDYSRGKFML